MTTKTIEDLLIRIPVLGYVITNTKSDECDQIIETLAVTPRIFNGVPNDMIFGLFSGNEKKFHTIPATVPSCEVGVYLPYGPKGSDKYAILGYEYYGATLLKPDWKKVLLRELDNQLAQYQLGMATNVIVEEKLTALRAFCDKCK